MPHPVSESEFGVSSTIAFVEMLNGMRRSGGKLPVPQGSFPKRASDLGKLVNEARQLRAAA